LEVVRERCAGLDVHKRFVTAAVILRGAKPVVREFATETPELLKLVDWLQELRVDDVAMEATGSYWKPVYNLLEAAGLRPIVGNAAMMKAVPGRKTDVKDAEWICDLHRHGLISPSFIPPRAQRELREVVDYRGSLIAERAAEANRIAKVLEGANIKLGSVATDILGKSGRDMLAAIVGGTTDPEALASLARGRMQRKHDALVGAFHGSIGAHQRLMLRMQLAHVEHLDRQITELDQEIATRLAPFQKELERLDTIPGVNQRLAEVILARVGADMTPFPNADHLVSWGGMCPGSNESGGKRRRARTRKGDRTLRSALVQAGYAAGRTKDTYLGAIYRRIAARRGAKRAAVAVGRSILEIAYFVLRDGVEYKDLGVNYYDERKKDAVVRGAVRRLERLGYKVTVSPAA
jgi:transposase